MSVPPFSCGTQYGAWTESNCARCQKSYENNPAPISIDTASAFPAYPCEIEIALVRAYCGDGTVSEDIARRMGWTLPEKSLPDYVWPCGEVEWTEEWKAVCTRKQEQA